MLDLLPYRLVKSPIVPAIRGGARGWHGGQPPISFKKEKRKRKKGKFEKKEEIITNDHNAVYKWVKTDECLRE